MIKLPAAGLDGRTDQGLLPSLSPPEAEVPEPDPVVDVDEELVARCVDAAMLTKVSVATTGDSTGGMKITGRLRSAEGMTNTLRAARLFRFELFFLADTPICMVNSTSTTDIAMIDIRTGLTIF